MTRSERRPWWASEGPVAGGVDRAVDPLELARAARRPTDGTPAEVPFDADDWLEHGPGAPVAWGDAEPGDGDEAADQRDDGDPSAAHVGEDHDLDVCGVCPICVGLRLLQDTRPELVRHLGEAARHLVAAARAVVETPVRGDPDEDRQQTRPTSGLERIVLDTDETDGDDPATAAEPAPGSGATHE